MTAIEHFSPFMNVVSQRFLDVYVLSGFACQNCRQCVPVVRGRNHNDIDFLKIQNLTEIRKGFRLTGTLSFRHFGSQGAIVFPHVAHCGYGYILHEHEIAKISASHSPDTNKGRNHAVIRTLHRTLGDWCHVRDGNGCR